MERDFEMSNNNYLFVDDIFKTDAKPIPKEFLEKHPISKSGKIFSGTFGTFNAREFENTMRRTDQCLK